jgi:hypothetical protein
VRSPFTLMRQRSRARHKAGNGEVLANRERCDGGVRHSVRRNEPDPGDPREVCPVLLQRCFGDRDGATRAIGNEVAVA